MYAWMWMPACAGLRKRYKANVPPSPELGGAARSPRSTRRRRSRAEPSGPAQGAPSRDGLPPCAPLQIPLQTLQARGRPHVRRRRRRRRRRRPRGQAPLCPRPRALGEPRQHAQHRKGAARAPPGRPAVHAAGPAQQRQLHLRRHRARRRAHLRRDRGRDTRHRGPRRPRRQAQRRRILARRPRVALRRRPPLRKGPPRPRRVHGERARDLVSLPGVTSPASSTLTRAKPNRTLPPLPSRTSACARRSRAGTATCGTWSAPAPCPCRAASSSPSTASATPGGRCCRSSPTPPPSQKTDPYSRGLDLIKPNYVGGGDGVVMDPESPFVARLRPDPAHGLSSATSAALRWTKRTPLMLAVALVPIGTVAFLCNSVVQTIRSLGRIRQHEKGGASFDVAGYRVPLLIKELRGKVERAYGAISSSQSHHFLATDDHDDDMAPEQRSFMRRERRQSVASQPTLALTPEQFEMIRSLDTLGWRKYPVWIRNNSHSHAAIIVRMERKTFDEGWVVLRHFVDHDFFV